MSRLLIALLLVIGVSLGGLALAQQAGEGTSQGETSSGDTAVNEEAEAEQREPVWLQRDTATLRGLDKITGRSTDFVVTVGEAVAFGSLRVSLDVCYQKPPEEPPESAAFLQISGTRPMYDDTSEDPLGTLFSGWMFASSPGLNALEHPVYDVWVIECAPQTVAATETP